MTKILIAYFSASGTTKAVVEKIANENDYDIFEIEPEVKYSPEDLDWTDKNSRSTVEMNDKSFRPPIKKICDVSGYDTIVVGFPVWWYTAPSIINTFIESVDLTDKTIKVFCTSGSSGVEKCVSDLQECYPKLNFSEGIRFTGDISKVQNWINF